MSGHVQALPIRFIYLCFRKSRKLPRYALIHARECAVASDHLLQRCTLRTDDGNLSSGAITASSNCSDYNDDNTDSTATFSLDAHCSCCISMPASTSIHRGYGVIQWDQDSDQLQGLVAYGIFKANESSNNAASFNIDINNSLPF